MYLASCCAENSISANNHKVAGRKKNSPFFLFFHTEYRNEVLSNGFFVAMLFQAITTDKEILASG